MITSTSAQSAVVTIEAKQNTIMQHPNVRTIVAGIDLNICNPNRSIKVFHHHYYYNNDKSEFPKDYCPFLDLDSL